MEILSYLLHLPLAVWGAALACLVLFFAWRVSFWMSQGRKMQTSGHLPPPPSIFARLFFYFAVRLLAFLGIGPVKVVGRKNAQVRGRAIFVANHTFPFDFTLAAIGPNCARARFMTKTAELRGMRGVFGAWTGAIPVDKKQQGGGQAAVDASVKALVSSRKSRLLIFPQGALIDMYTILREHFANGWSRIAQAVKAQTNEPVYIVPMALYYHRDRSKATLSSYLLKPVRRMMGVTNYGATVVIGQPIEISSLPADPEQATDVIHDVICDLFDQARGEQPRRTLASGATVDDGIARAAR